MSGVGEAVSAASTANELDASRALNAEYLRLHPDEVARFLETRQPQENAVLLSGALPTTTALLLERMNPRVAAQTIESLPQQTVVVALSTMNPARAAPILVSCERATRDALLARLDPRAAEAIREMVAYPSDTAGGLMDPRITAFSGDLTVDDALRRMRSFKEKEFDAIYVSDAEGRLTGAVPLGEIATALPERRLADLIRAAPATVATTATREEVVEFLKDRRLVALPVVDGGGHLVGVIRYSQLVAAAEAEASIGLQTMVGAGKDERALSPVLYAVRQRLPWLEINLATAFLAASVVGLFEGTISQFTALAVLMPVVAGQSGNSGMQALAVTIRGLTLREVSLRHWPRLIVKEAGVGIVNGLAIAVTTMAGVFLWSRSLGLVLVIGLAMVMSMIIAGICGTLVPVVLKALGQDPAQSSSVVLTTFTDCGGFLCFLGLATIFSSLLQ